MFDYLFLHLRVCVGTIIKGLAEKILQRNSSYLRGRARLASESRGEAAKVNCTVALDEGSYLLAIFIRHKDDLIKPSENI